MQTMITQRFTNHSECERGVKQNRCEVLMSLAMKLRSETIEKVPRSEIVSLAKDLIDIYDSPFLFPDDVRNRAARTVARLAGMDKRVLGTLIDNANRYAQDEHGDDAFPYNPNSFDVLAIVQPVSECVACYLRGVVERDSGPAACYSAAEALRVIAGREQRAIDGAELLIENEIVVDTVTARYTRSGDGR